MDDSSSVQETIVGAEPIGAPERKALKGVRGRKGKAAAAVQKPSSEKSAASNLDKKASKPAAAPWTFPKNTLEDAIKIPRALEEQNAGNAMKPDMIAKAVGYNSVSDWRFLDLLRSANLYGLVTGSGKISSVDLTQVGQDVVAPSSPAARPRALQTAFRNVDDFKRVEDFYKGKKLPEDEFLKIRCFENLLYLASGYARL